jgi:hypothetical protein
MNLSIRHSIQQVTIRQGQVARNGVRLAGASAAAFATPEAMYEALGCAYPKFFKMDMLCKWAWLASEYLLLENGVSLYEGIPAEKIGVVLFTRSGCLEADKRYHDTLATVPSPALFVYTLPNIMLGEICIRHGFKGEQLCMVQEEFDSQELLFWVRELLQKRDMEACLYGWVDVTEDQTELILCWAVGSDADLRAPGGD